MILQFLNGEKSGGKKQVTPPGLGIGRETDNDIQLLIGGVSRYHAKVEWKNEKWIIRDLGSTNGTKLNGTLIAEPVELNNGDVIAIGEQMFRVDEIAPQKKEEQTSAPTFVFRPPEQSTPPAAPPLATQIVQEAATPQSTGNADKKPEPEEDLTDIKSGMSLFGKKKKKQDDPGSREKTDKQKRRLLSANALFYVLVVMVGIFCVALFWKFQSANMNKKNNTDNIAAHAIIKNPFLLYYEKFTITKQNSVFKFKLLLENNKIKFSLDDLQSGRVYAPVINEKLDDAVIEKLKKAIEDTNFMESKQQENFEIEEENDRNYVRLIIGYDDKFNDITVSDIPLASFTKVENAIITFLQEEIGLDPSMAESKEVLLKQAKHSFDLAENQFNSYKNQPGNLWRSIENYRIAMKRYEVFADKPKEWSIARDRFIKAQEIHNKIRTEGQKRINLLYGQKEYRRAVEECDKLMAFFRETSPTYEKIRSTKLIIETKISRNK